MIGPKMLLCTVMVIGVATTWFPAPQRHLVFAAGILIVVGLTLLWPPKSEKEPTYPQTLRSGAKPGLAQVNPKLWCVYTRRVPNCRFVQRIAYGFGKTPEAAYRNWYKSHFSN